GWDKTVKVWDAVTGKEVLTLRGHDSVVHAIAFSPDGKQLATGSGDRTVKLWALPGNGGGVFAQQGGTGPVFLTSDGKRMVRRSSAQDKDPQSSSGVTVWDTATGQVLRKIETRQDPVGRAVAGIAMSPDGKRLAGTWMVFNQKQPESN